MSGSGYYNSVQYPWLTQFDQVYEDLKTVGPHVPANYQSAYNAVLKSGHAIQDAIDAGNTISADNVNQWLYASHNLVARFPSGNLPSETDQTVSDSTILSPYAQDTDTMLSEIETVAIVGAVIIGALLLLPVLLKE